MSHDYGHGKFMCDPGGDEDPARRMSFAEVSNIEQQLS